MRNISIEERGSCFWNDCSMRNEKWVRCDACTMFTVLLCHCKWWVSRSRSEKNPAFTGERNWLRRTRTQVAVMKTHISKITIGWFVGYKKSLIVYDLGMFWNGCIKWKASQSDSLWDIPSFLFLFIPYCFFSHDERNWEPYSMLVYSDVSPIIFNRANAQVSVDKVATF